MRSDNYLLGSLVGGGPSIIASCLTELFACFNSIGIKWAVMRGWERLPYWTRYDVDVLVARNDEKRSVEIVKHVASETGWKVYGVLKQGMMHSIWMLKEDGESGQSYLRIDIETGNSYRGVEIHESQKCLKDRILVERENGCLFWRMPDGYAAVAVLLKQMAVSGAVDTERRRQQVMDGLGDPQFSVLLRDALRDTALADELCAALSRGDWDAANRCGRRVQKRLFRKTPANLMRMVWYGIGLLGQMAKPYMRCLIVLVGPDGCGKTTIADAIEKRFKGRPFQGVLRIHMRFGVPRMRSVAATLCRIMGKPIRQQEEPAPGTRHMGMQPPHSLLRAMLYVTYYGFGSIFGRLKLMLWRKQGGLVVADRFFQDYYYMRGYMKCPKLYVRIMEFLTPKPDMIVILNRPAEDIYAQKPELTIEEIKREQNTISQWLASRRNAVVIDASKGIEQTESGVIGRIEDWLTKKSIKASAQSV